MNSDSTLEKIRYAVAFSEYAFRWGGGVRGSACNVYGLCVFKVIKLIFAG